MVHKGGDIRLIGLLLVEHHVFVRDGTGRLLGRIVVGRRIGCIRLGVWAPKSLAAPPRLVRGGPRVRLGRRLSRWLILRAAGWTYDRLPRQIVEARVARLAFALGAARCLLVLEGDRNWVTSQGLGAGVLVLSPTAPGHVPDDASLDPLTRASVRLFRALPPARLRLRARTRPRNRPPAQ
jgi:hypothetical protein